MPVKGLLMMGVVEAAWNPIMYWPWEPATSISLHRSATGNSYSEIFEDDAGPELHISHGRGGRWKRSLHDWQTQRERTQLVKSRRWKM